MGLSQQAGPIVRRNLLWVGTPGLHSWVTLAEANPGPAAFPPVASFLTPVGWVGRRLTPGENAVHVNEPSNNLYQACVRR